MRIANKEEATMNPTEAKFRDDLDAITSELQHGVKTGRFSWTDVQHRLDGFTQKTNQLASATDQYLHRHTWTALAVASGLGLAIGLLLGRR
jgi:ElaB/YqjD/DUF883 family membrane-anchored ribosome-binding protein